MGPVLSSFSAIRGAFVSTWPVLTEVCHLIPADVAPPFLESALELMATLMRQYGGLPMDLADASPLWVAQQHGIYRLPGGESLENLLDP